MRNKLGQFIKGSNPGCGGFKKGYTPWNKGKKLPYMGFKKGHIPWNKNLKGYMAREKNCNWKGGKIKRGAYTYILKPSHPYCDKYGYVKRSRLVMENKIGRFLTPTERVHHINKIKFDDRSKNLQLFPNESEHQKLHSKIKYQGTSST